MIKKNKQKEKKLINKHKFGNEMLMILMILNYKRELREIECLKK